MTDSTPTAVTVSDQMRGLVEDFMRACHATGSLTHSAEIALVREHDRIEFEKEETLLREIAALEAKATRYDHLFPHSSLGKISDAPAAETPTTNPSETSNSLGVSAPPQTLGGGIPDFVARQVRLAEMMTSEPLYSIDTIRWLAKDRARLVEALEQEQHLCRTWKQHNDLKDERIEKLSAEIESLQSSAALQKEELDKIRDASERLASVALGAREFTDELCIDLRRVLNVLDGFTTSGA